LKEVSEEVLKEVCNEVCCNVAREEIREELCDESRLPMTIEGTTRELPGPDEAGSDPLQPWRATAVGLAAFEACGTKWVDREVPP
jgi:hypothetical protein